MKDNIVWVYLRHLKKIISKINLETKLEETLICHKYTEYTTINRNNEITTIQ